jgi:hypothetical protein
LKEELALSIAHAASSQNEDKDPQKKKYKKLTEDVRRKQQELADGEIGIVECLCFVSHKFNFSI